MPEESLPDPFDMRAHLRPAHALLDRLAAADTGGNLAIAMKADQAAAAKHRLRLLGGARNEPLYQHLIGKGLTGVEIAQCAFQIIRVAHEPDAAARGADRGLDHRRKAD